MLSLTSALVLASISFIFIYFLIKNKLPGKRLPPGPIGLPWVGNLLQMGKVPHLKLNEWGYQYGKMFTIKMGPNKVVVLSDPQLIREAFNDPNLNGRPDVESFHILAGGKHGIISSDGSEWLEQRRFTLRHLRDFGFGRNPMEELIITEVNDYVSWLKSNEGQEVSVIRQFSLAVLNSLWVILAGKRYRHDDPRLVSIFEENTKVSTELSNSPAIFVPQIAKLIPKLSGWDNLMDLVKSMRGVCTEAIEEHKRNFTDEENPRDFIDAYLSEIKSTTNPTSSFYKDAGDASLRAVISDMFGAGSETTALTLSWSVLYLTKFPLVQKKLQKELDVVVGKNRQPSLLDRPNLPFCEATILEILDTWLIPNLYHLHFNEDIWDSPKEFKPERHLTNGGKTIKRSDAFLPFSIGKRVCLGQSLANDSIFLFFTNIFQRFQIRLADQSQEVTLDPKPAFLLGPQEFKIIVQDRV